MFYKRILSLITTITILTTLIAEPVLAVGFSNDDPTQSVVASINEILAQQTENTTQLFSVNDSNAPQLKGPNLVVSATTNSDVSANTYRALSIQPLAANLPFISTFAGTGIAGYSGDGGLATLAQLDKPRRLAVDSAGSVYITESASIRKIDKNGNISTFAGTGTAGYSGDNGLATSAQLNGPYGIAVDSAGIVYFADRGNNRIRKVDKNGNIATIAGTGTAGFSGDNGPAISAQLNLPSGLAVDSASNIYIADTENNRIRKVSAGKISTIAGTGDYANYNNGDCDDRGPIDALTKAGFLGPVSVGVDSAGSVYIGDGRKGCLRKLSNGYVSTIAGNIQQEQTALDAKRNPDGPALGKQWVWTDDLAIVSSGDIYTAEAFNKSSRIRKISGGNISTITGTGTPGYSGDYGPPATAELYSPYGVAVDSAGNVYIADTNNNVIRKISSGPPVHIPATLQGVTQSFFVVKLSARVTGLSASSIKLDNSASVTDVQTTDNGFTYVVSTSPLTENKAYTATISDSINLPGAAFDPFTVKYSSISSISSQLLDKLATNMIVKDATTGNILTNASIQFEGNTYNLNGSNVLKYYGDKGFGIKDIAITSSGYRKLEQHTNVLISGQSVFFLTTDAGDGKPYVKMADDMVKYQDLRSVVANYSYPGSDMLKLTVRANWQSRTPASTGAYVLYQQGDASANPRTSGKRIVSNDGNFNFAPSTLNSTLTGGEPVYLKLVSSDGTESTPILLNIKVFIRPYTSSLEKQRRFAPAPPASGSSSGKSSKFYPPNFDVSAGPVSVQSVKEIDPNGDVTYRGVIGLSITDLLEKSPPPGMPSAWQQLKQDFALAKSSKAGSAWVNQKYKDKYVLSKGAFETQKSFKTTATTFGYFEVKYDVFGKQLSSSGGIIVDVNAVANKTFVFGVGPVPCYFSITAGLHLNTAIGTTYDDIAEKRIYNGTLGITFSLDAEGGAGVKGLASVGVGGDASLVITVNSNLSNNGVFNAEAYVHLYLLFFFDWKWSFANYRATLWNNGPAARSLLMAPGSQDPDIAKELSLMSRDYTKKTSAWNGGGKAVPSLLRGSSDPMQTLQSSVMPSTTSQIVKLDNKLVMLFQADDATKTTGNNVVLNYSIYDNGTWSEPRPVWQGQTSDFFAKASVINGELYVTWQKSRFRATGTDPNALLTQSVQNSEIAFAQFNKTTGVFENQQFLTNNSLLDMYPTLTSDSKGNVVVVWVNNDANDATGASGSYNIFKRTQQNDTWSVAASVYTTKDYITDIAAGYVDGHLDVAYSTQAPEGTPNIYLIQDGHASAISNAGDIASDVKFYNGAVYWSSDNYVYRYDVARGNLTTLQPGANNAFNSSYRLVSNASKTAIVWMRANSDKTTTVYESIINADGTASNPIKLYTSTGSNAIRFMDVALMDDGTWNFVANLSQYDDASDTTTNSIGFANIPPIKNISMDYLYANVFTNVYATANSLPVRYTITNNGENVLTSFRLTATNGSKTLINKEVTCNIAPGATSTFDDTLDISSITGQATITVTATQTGETELSDNAQTITLGVPDVGLALTMYKNNNLVDVIARVSNYSKTPAHVTLTVTEDSPTGKVLDTKNLGTVGHTADASYNYTFDLKNVRFGSSNAKSYYFTISTTESNLNQETQDVVTFYPDVIPTPNTADPIQTLSHVYVTGVSVTSASSDFVGSGPTSGTLTLNINDSSHNNATLQAVVTPANATIPAVKWKAVNVDVADVDDSGNITAQGVGTTQITATTYDGSYVATVNVVVVDGSKALTITQATGGSVSNRIAGNYKIDDIVNLVAIPAPGYAFSGWSSSNDGTFADSISPSTTFTMPSNATTITPSFVPVEPISLTGPNPAQAPTITTQPQGAIYSLNADPANLTIVVNHPTDSGNLSYQWYKNTTGTVDIVKDTLLATSAEITPDTRTSGIYYYYVVVTNTLSPYNLTSTESSLAKIQVVGLASTPTVSVSPSTRTVNQFDDLTSKPLMVTANVIDGGTLSYQWYEALSSTPNSDTDKQVGTNSKSYVPDTSNAGTYYYYSKVTNNLILPTNTATATSNVLVLTINKNAEKPSIIAQPQDTSYKLGGNVAVLTVLANTTDGGKLSYQWYANTANSNTGGTILTGETNSTYTPSVNQTGTYYYYSVVTNTNSGVAGLKTNTTASNVAIVSVNVPTPPTISAEPQDATYTQGAIPTDLFVESASTNGGTLSYQWYKNTTGLIDVSVDEKVGTNLSTYTPITVFADISYYYSVAMDSIGTNNSKDTRVARIAVNPRRDSNSNVNTSAGSNGNSSDGGSNGGSNNTTPSTTPPTPTATSLAPVLTQYQQQILEKPMTPSEVDRTLQKFVDVQESWAKNDLAAAVELGLVNGVSTTTMAPDQSTSRMEFIAILVRNLGLASATEDEMIKAKAYFTDWDSIPVWSQSYIASAFANGIMAGESDNGLYYAKATRYLTREEAAVLMSNAYSNVLHQSNAQNNFDDKSIISTWAVNAVNKLVTNGILVGYPDGTFKGSKDITRAEGVTMIMKILRNYVQTNMK
ncbi:NHL repeat-containing protein [Paenibacillus sp. 1_12]|uniref:NHL domain-containing protein n=1 Tax=Paenibacillus sp. 1_12 TaxID=1566278 RepID=UPI0008E44C65|nr:S-layer homology domain-containing protein [Paenibacillus sp. 1_12]SFM28915.1 NHL repeat-containing protein [Paenibacillus sp. 1_12]